MKTLFRNMTIHYKIIIVFIPLILLPLIVVSFTSNSIFTDSMIVLSENNMSDESRLIATRVTSILDNTNTGMQFLAMNIIEIYKADGGQVSFFSTIKKRNQILSTIHYDIRQFQEIDYAAFLDLESNIIATNAVQPEILDGTPNQSTLNALFALDHTRNTWFPLEKRNYLVKNGDVPIFSLGKKVVELESGSALGYLILNLREDSFSSIFPVGDTQSSKMFRIVDQDGQILSSSNKNELFTYMGNWEDIRQTAAESFQITDSQGEKLLLTKIPVGQMGWWLVASIGYNELVEKAYVNTAVILTVGILCVGMAFLCALLLSRLISNPIIRLTHSAEQVRSGDMTVTFSSNSADEVGMLSSTFGMMMEKVRLLLEEVKREQQTNRKIEFDLLQSQLQPHFLYNTMETINMLIRLNMKEQALKTSNSLVEFYRISLSKGNSIIKIREELCLIENYLSIQALRYVEYMDYSIQSVENIMEFEIPKLTLQPLVENAIYHGLKSKGVKGHISISGEYGGDVIYLYVRDNGIGMTEEQIDATLRHSNSTRSSFGVSSIDLRLKLLYGEHAGITLESELGVYTKATIRLPVKK